MEVAVFGAGSLGSLIGGLLARHHDVVLVGRDPHVTAIRDDGLHVTGVEDFVVHPDATTDGRELSADLVAVTVKSFDTEAAARDLSTGRFDGVLSLQNGLGNEDVLADHLDCPVLAGATTHGAILQEPGLVEWSGRGEVVLGGWRPAESPLVERTARAFDEAGLDPRVESDMRYELWLKLAVNAAINPITALARVRNGAIRNGPAADLAREAAREVAAVARAQGTDLPADVAVQRVDAVAEATAENRSSMYEDVAAGERTEIDELNGSVVERAGGTDAPVNGLLTALVRAWEVGRGLR